MSIEPKELELVIARCKHDKENEADYPRPVIQHLELTRGELQFIIWPPYEKPPFWPANEPYNSKDAILSLADYAVGALGIERCLLISDTYVMRGTTDTEDFDELAAQGKRNMGPYKSLSEIWAAGEGDKYGVTEGLVIEIVTRSADDPKECDYEEVHLPYTQRRDGVTWEEPFALPDSATRGYLKRRLREAFAKGQFAKLAMEDERTALMLRETLAATNRPEEEIQFVADCIVLKELGKQKATVAFFGDSATTHRYERAINESGEVGAFRVKPNRSERRAQQKKAHR